MELKGTAEPGNRVVSGPDSGVGHATGNSDGTVESGRHQRKLSDSLVTLDMQDRRALQDEEFKSGIPRERTLGALDTTFSDAASRSGAESRHVAQTDGSELSIPFMRIVELHSSSIASSAAFPRGEALGFTISPNGCWVAAISSSRVYVINARQIPGGSVRAFQIWHRPVAVTIHNDGSILALLTDEHLLNIYRLNTNEDDQIQVARSIHLTVPSRKVIISPDGRLLVAVNEDGYGVEFVSLVAAANERDRRSVRCDGFDYGMFSLDNRTFLGSSTHTSSPSSVLISVHPFDGPLDEEGIPMAEPSNEAWTRRILFPQSISRMHHASLLPSLCGGPAEEMVAVEAGDDGVLHVINLASPGAAHRTFALLDSHSNSTPKFTLESVPPAVSDSGVAAIAVKDNAHLEIWLYDLLLDNKYPSTQPTAFSSHSNHGNTRYPFLRIPKVEADGWTLRNITDLKWCSSPGDLEQNSVQHRLVAISNVSEPETYEDGSSFNSFIAGGRIIAMDFGKSNPRGTETIQMNLDDIAPQTRLHNEELDIETEVELVRKRTVVQKRMRPLRPSTSVVSRSLTSRRDSRRRSLTESHNSGDNGTTEELEVPYANAQPRSPLSLHRAASVAAVSPASRRHLQALPSRPLEYIRADGRPDPPHESDADNWVPPPPPYTRDPDSSGGIGGLVVAATFPQLHGHASDGARASLPIRSSTLDTRQVDQLVTDPTPLPQEIGRQNRPPPSLATLSAGHRTPASMSVNHSTTDPRTRHARFSSSPPANVASSDSPHSRNHPHTSTLPQGSLSPHNITETSANNTALLTTGKSKRIWDKASSKCTVM
jgi:hypothetical protein